MGSSVTSTLVAPERREQASTASLCFIVNQMNGSSLVPLALFSVTTLGLLKGEILDPALAPVQSRVSPFSTWKKKPS